MEIIAGANILPFLSLVDVLFLVFCFFIFWFLEECESCLLLVGKSSVVLICLATGTKNVLLSIGTYNRNGKWLGITEKLHKREENRMFHQDLLSESLGYREIHVRPQEKVC